MTKRAKSALCKVEIYAIYGKRQTSFLICSKNAMGRGFLICMVLIALFCSCEKGTVREDITAFPDKDSTATLPAETLIISLDGIRQRISLQGSMHDTIILQEEGLRSFGIIGYEPQDAVPPVIDSINFYRDVYSFNYSGDSILIMGGSYAAPRSHYLAFLGRSFNDLKGVEMSGSTQVLFYNYVNRSYDKCTIEKDGELCTVWWRDLGKLRSYRIEVVLKQSSGENRFTIPFYEKENGVFLPDTITIAPGDTLQLPYQVSAPAEFTISECAVGIANDAISPLDGQTVSAAFQKVLENPLLTEEGKRYTCSKVHLTPEGLLWVDADYPQHFAHADIVL